MRSAQQTKALIRNVARERGVSAQLVLQNYMLERFLERVSVSRFRGDFIIKGGFVSFLAFTPEYNRNIGTSDICHLRVPEAGDAMLSELLQST